MMAATFIIFALLVTCSYALPLKRASTYGSPLLVPVVIQELDDPLLINEKPINALNDGISNIEKRSAEEADDDEDLETAAGTNLLRPLFVYRQQVAYRQRARDAIRRGRRI